MLSKRRRRIGWRVERGLAEAMVIYAYAGRATILEMALTRIVFGDRGIDISHDAKARACSTDAPASTLGIALASGFLWLAKHTCGGARAKDSS